LKSFVENVSHSEKANDMGKGFHLPLPFVFKKRFVLMCCKGSFKFAWLMDKLREERERGISIQYKLWTLQSNEDPDRQIDLIDTPGHLSFIKSMSIGSSLADTAVVVVSAAKGEFESGWSSAAKNTQRELLICASQGIKRFVFAINKMGKARKEREKKRFVFADVFGKRHCGKSGSSFSGNLQGN
jgi:translation elongation factor EF-1alpha